MKDSARLRRHLCLIRYTDSTRYPTLLQLTHYLREQDFDKHSEKTVERDLKDIRADYGIPILYDRKQRGYRLTLDSDEDMADMKAYIALLERRERLEALTRPGREAVQYIQLEAHDGFRGLDLLEPLYRALQQQLVVTFEYRAFGETDSRPRRVEPGLLYEFRNRWYLDGYALDVAPPKNGQRTYGLDRIQQLTLTTEPTNPKRAIDYRAARRNVIGVTAKPEQDPERVVLRFTGGQRDYVRSLPLHHSQAIEADTATYLTVSLYVKVNPELINQLLMYGEFAEVLEPQSLRDTMSSRIRAMGELYSP